MLLVFYFFIYFVFLVHLAFIVSLFERGYAQLAGASALSNMHRYASLPHAFLMQTLLLATNLMKEHLVGAGGSAWQV